MKVYYHHVGVEGSNEDFPKTIFNKIPLALVDMTLRDRDSIKQILINQLTECFPQGHFNCWGVPSQASIVIKNLQEGDAVLLVKGVNAEGEVPALGIVKVFIPEEMRDLSFALWGNSKYPYIFFFDTKEINLTWMELVDLLGYSDNFDPRGNFYSIADWRLDRFGGAKNFIENLLKDRGVYSYSFSHPDQIREGEALYEGAKISIDVNAYERNPVARQICIDHFGVICSVCGFNFEKEYGALGKGYIHIHHLKSLTEIGEEYEVDPLNDLRPLCPNCHAMIHRASPMKTIEELKRIRKKEQI